MTLPIQALRAKLAAAVLGAVVLTAGQALARNHDCQAFKLPSDVVALHDRAPGPASRVPN